MAAMAPRPRTPSPLVLFVVVVATVVASASDAAASRTPMIPSSASSSKGKAPPPPPPPCAASQSVLAFLRARCATTLYRVTCYESLVPYGCTFQTSPLKLARAAAEVNAAHLRTFSARIKELVAAGGDHQDQGGSPAAAAALRDCASTISSASGLAKQSAGELAALDGAAPPPPTERQVRWAISNAQTWLSAAMTNEATCADGLGAAGAVSSPTSKELVAGVVTARQHTSVALALVNGITST